MKSDVGHRLPAETLSSDISIIIYIFFLFILGHENYIVGML